MRAQPLAGAHLDEPLVLRAIDEVPILSVLAANARGGSEIRGAGELRVKETDDERAVEAAASCPMNAIAVFDTDTGDLVA